MFFCKTINSIYIPICLYFNATSLIGKVKYSLFTFQYVSILIEVQEAVDYLDEIIYIPICLYFNGYGADFINEILAFTFQYVSILIHRPNSLFFSNLFPRFLLTSQSLQIFYHISLINSTK